MEIIEGRKLVSHQSVFIRFQLRDRENEYLLIWTTTPWTLTSNVVVGVNIDLDYVKLRAVDGSIYYIAQENLEFQRLEKQYNEKKQWIEGVPKLKTIAQIFKERGGYEILETIKGADMVGWQYIGPYDDLDAQKVPGGHPFTNDELKQKNVSSVDQHQVVNPGKDNIGNDIVVAGEGTGIVHMAPGCGDIDHQIGKIHNLVNLAPLDDEAKFIKKFDWLEGKNATDIATTKAIITDLKKRGLLVYVEDYPHIYPHCWRSGDELVFRLVEEWYINMDWRGKIKNIVDDIEWIPTWGREREHEWLDNMSDWMISKKRFWGLALPIWTFDDGSFHVVGSKDELKQLSVEGWNEYDGQSPHRPWIDKVKIRHPETGLIGTRVLDVGNPWLDAGIVPFSTLGYLTDNDYWKRWFPGDFVTECFPGQFRHWFYSLLAMSALLEEKAPFKTLLGHALVKDETGRDMHKSWGNAIWFDEAAEKMGVDVMRWMYARQNLENNLLFGYRTADDVRKKLITFWNVYSFFATYAAVDNFDPENDGNLEEDFLTILDKWILAKMHLLIRDGRKAMDQYNVFMFMKLFELFLDDVSNWYVRRNRRRFWKSEDDSDKKAAYATLYHVLVNTIKCLSPILPFTTETVYQNLVKHMHSDTCESVHLTDFPDENEKWINDDLITKVDTLKKLVELGRSARSDSDQKIRQPLAKVLFALEDDDLANFIIENQGIILDELNVKGIERITNADELITYKIRPNLKTLGQRYGSGLTIIRALLESSAEDKWINEFQRSGQIKIGTQDREFILEKDDIFIDTIADEGFSAASGSGLTVGLSLELTRELVQEGIVRDMVRQVQNLRRDANLAVEDRIRVFWDLDGRIASALGKFRTYFCSETLTKSIGRKFKKGDHHGIIEIQGEQIKIGIEKV
jgi:isoleucyl-tRNA synthetase